MFGSLRTKESLIELWLVSVLLDQIWMISHLPCLEESTLIKLWVEHLDLKKCKLFHIDQNGHNHLSNGQLKAKICSMEMKNYTSLANK